MKIFRQSYTFLMSAAIALILVSLTALIFLQNPSFCLFIALISVFLFVWLLWFFRIPERQIEEKPGMVYSPADGKIVAVNEVYEDEYLKSDCIMISVFMSVFNVHQNRVPLSGRVVYTKYHKGKYLVAWHPKSSLKNERNTIVIQNPAGEKILIRQIAGFVAHRIICRLKEGDTPVQGDELGFIMFGSRVDVFLPPETRITVTKGDKVKANRNIIGVLHYIPEPDLQS